MKTSFVFVAVFLLAAVFSTWRTAQGRPSSTSEHRQRLLHHHQDSSVNQLQRQRKSDPDNYESMVMDVAVNLFTNTPDYCSEGLTDSGVSIQLQYRSMELLPNLMFVSTSEWKPLDDFKISPVRTQFSDDVTRDESDLHGFRCENVASVVNVTGIRWIQFRLRQLEHGGGLCNCWSTRDFRVGNIPVDFSDRNNHCLVHQGERNNLIMLTGNQAAASCNTDLNSLISQDTFTFCGGSSSVVRGIVSKVIDLDPPEQAANEGPDNTVPTSFSLCAGDEQLVDVDSTSTEEEIDFTTAACHWTFPHIEVNFQLSVGLLTCDKPDWRDEGVEVSFGNWNGSGEWIPIRYYAPSDTPSGPNQRIRIGNVTNNTIPIRGWNVPYEVHNTSGIITASLFVCDDSLLRRNGPMQFRWLQTVWQVDAERDLWSLDNITITLYLNDTVKEVLVDEDFQSFNASLWNIRKGELLNKTINTPSHSSQGCDISEDDSDNAVFAFGFKSPIFTNNINSRFISTTPIDVETLLEGVPTITLPPFTPPVLGDGFPEPTITVFVDPRAELLRLEEERIRKIIFRDPELHAVFIAPSVKAAELLEEFIERESEEDTEVDEAVIVYLLGNIFMNTSAVSNITDPEFNEAIVEIASGVLKRTNPDDNNRTVALFTITGSTLLRQLDNFALNVFDNVDPIQADMIEHHVFENEEDEEDTGGLDDMISLIDVQGAQISVPRQLLGMFGGQMKIRVGSFFYQNMSGLLPETLEDRDEDDTQLASPVISTILQCDDEPGGRCPTEDLVDLDQPIRITIPHTAAIKKRIAASNSTQITCVFWKFFERDAPGSILSSGNWSTTGCTRNDSLSDDTVTVCDCNHLTHFAILLSATGTSFSSGVTLSLEIIGYVGVGVSLIAMIATILVFIFFKPLWSMRSYIHINLCVNLIIVQIIFVAGIEPRLNSNDPSSSVPVSCQVVAVLLHYFFLVGFMWMLMEGVVLYVVLVRVFVKYKKRYLFVFTLLSYGLPLLYMGALTLPLGFALSGVSGYGYETACFLNPATKFIWAFIAPVIVIILVNIGFFIMAMTIMFRHQKRQTNKSTIKNVRHWLKASISLLVVMGITWILGVLVLNVDALLPVAYIFTILVAFQGVFIFILFVLFSEQVQDARRKWWKSKVAESEFLSRHFGENVGSTKMSGMRSVPSSSMEKSSQSPSGADRQFELGERTSKIPLHSRSSEEKTPPVESEKKVTLKKEGTTFEVTLVPTGSLENLTDDAFYETKDKPKPDSITNGNLVNRPTVTAVPNDYQSHEEFMSNVTSNSHPV